MVFFLVRGSFKNRRFLCEEHYLDKPAIGVDLDDTVIEFVTGFLAYHNRVYGSALSWHHLPDFDWHGVLGCTKGEASRRVIEFFHSDEHQQLGAVPGAKEALLLLRAKYDIIGITARSPESAPRWTRTP